MLTGNFKSVIGYRFFFEQKPSTSISDPRSDHIPPSQAFKLSPLTRATLIFFLFSILANITLYNIRIAGPRPANRRKPDIIRF